MIVTPLAAADRYLPMHPALAKAFAFLRQVDARTFTVARVEIDGDKLYADVAVVPGRGHAGAKFETHRQHIDIQFVYEGEDEIAWKDAATCTPPVSYNPEKDAAKYDDTPENWFTLSAGMLAILYPEDAHAPLGGDPATSAKKVIVKILLT